MKIALIGYGKMGKEIEKIARSRGHEIVSIIDIDNRQDFASEEAFKNGVKVVSGSTGWMGEHGDEMRRLCQEEGKTLFWSSNFSLGVAIFSAVNKYLARIMNNFPNYEVSMVETHHIHKLDAPSGTAITLAEGILENLDRKDKWVMGTLTAPHPDGSGRNRQRNDRVRAERTACQRYPRRGSSGYPYHYLRIGSRLHRHYARCQEP